MKMERGYRSAVQVAAMSAVLLLMITFASFSSKGPPSNDLVSGLQAASGRRRLLLLRDNQSTDNPACNESQENPDCDDPMHKTNSCVYVNESCSDDVNLVNYLFLIACYMPQAKASRPSITWGENESCSKLLLRVIAGVGVRSAWGVAALSDLLVGNNRKRLTLPALYVS